MARLICLYVEDNEAAEAFVQETIETEGRFSCVVSDMNETIEGKMVPVALFAVPTQYCECDKAGLDAGKIASGQPADGKGIARGAKLGWWVHRTCGKPVYKGWQSPRNLLENKEEVAKETGLDVMWLSWSWRTPLKGSWYPNG
jgi:hypothetical protein